MTSVGGEPYDVDARSTRPQSLLITVYGAFSRAHDGWFPVSALVTMLDGLGVDEQSLRSAVSRLKRRGVLVAERHHDAAGYAISSETRAVFDVGDARVLDGVGTHDDEQWILVSFSIPETARDLRYRLRTRLTRIGAGQVDGGLWVAPRHLLPDVELVLDDLRARPFVSVFAAEHLGYEDTAMMVRRWWDLDVIDARYRAFVDAVADTQRRWSRARSRVDPVEAFVDYTRVLTAWRPLPYLDPGLPAALLPDDWSGSAAFDLFQSIRRTLAAPAAEFVRITVTP